MARTDECRKGVARRRDGLAPIATGRPSRVAVDTAADAAVRRPTASLAERPLELPRLPPPDDARTRDGTHATYQAAHPRGPCAARRGQGRPAREPVPRIPPGRWPRDPRG